MTRDACTVPAPEAAEELVRLAPGSFYEAVEVSLPLLIEWFRKEVSAPVTVLTPPSPDGCQDGPERWHSTCNSREP